MYAIIRCIFALIIAALCLLFIKKSKKERITLAIIAALAAAMVSSFIPIENTFVTFSSPEDACKYVYFNSNKIALTVDGNESSLMVLRSGNTYNYIIVPKSGDGWKLDSGMATGLNSKTRFVDVIRPSDEYTIEILGYAGTTEYYIEVTGHYSGISSISDSLGSDFYHLVSNSGAYHTYYAYINGYGEDYELTLNGETYNLKELSEKN